MSYQICPTWVGKPLNITVVGAGGTGSIMVGALALMSVALKELNHPGLRVLVLDDDTVSQANVARQAFFPCDIGQPKSLVLVNRVNQSFGLNFKARNERLEIRDDRDASWANTNLFIGCVDTRAARSAIHQAYLACLDGIYGNGSVGWLDCGNNANTGQVILGMGTTQQRNVVQALPTAADLFPEVIDASLDAKDDAPSCSLREALAKQDLFVNRLMADMAGNLLWQLLRYGTIDNHGVFVNLKTMRSNPVPVNPTVWERMGYKRPETQVSG